MSSHGLTLQRDKRSSTGAPKSSMAAPANTEMWIYRHPVKAHQGNLWTYPKSLTPRYSEYLYGRQQFPHSTMPRPKIHLSEALKLLWSSYKKVFPPSYNDPKWAISMIVEDEYTVHNEEQGNVMVADTIVQLKRVSWNALSRLNLMPYFWIAGIVSMGLTMMYGYSVCRKRPNQI